MTCPSHPNEGRLAIVTKRAVGCGGRVACERRTQAVAYGEVVWSRHPDAGAKLSRKTIAREGRSVSAEPVCSCAFFCADDLPVKYHANIDVSDPPFDRPPGHTPAQ